MLRFGRVILVFGIIGPILGGFAHWTYVAIQSTPIDGTLPANAAFLKLVTVFVLGVFGLLLAYPIGLIPAVSSGALYWAFTRKFGTHLVSALSQAIAGGTIAFVVTLIFGFIVLFGHEDNSIKTIWIWWSFPGAVSGAVCAVVAHALGKHK